jgi:hypothetical protein
MRLLLLVPALLAGCATQTDPTTVADIDLCRYQLRGGNNAMVAQQEAQRRGLDCRPYFPAIAAQDQAQDAAAANFFNSMSQPRRPMPQSRSCTTQRLGNTLHTDCW